MNPTFYSPSRGIWIWVRGAWKRLRCRHLPIPGYAGYDRCYHCRKWLL